MGTRYTVLLDDQALKSLERLRSGYGLKTKADVYDLAIRVLTWAADQEANGYEVGRFKGEDFQPLLMPFKLDKAEWNSPELAH